jgi:excinuclease UvrABC helicase subunit UvrB
MDEITFTGDLNYVTYLINKYKKDGYVYKEGTEKKGSPIVYRVVMKRQDPFEAISKALTSAMLNLIDAKMRELCPLNEDDKYFLQEQLSEAVEKEDYETAAKLRDKIKDLG